MPDAPAVELIVDRSIASRFLHRPCNLARPAILGYKNRMLRIAVCVCALLCGCRATVKHEPHPFTQPLPGSTVTFTMRPVHLSEQRVLWFAETETTWNAYDVFYLRLDEVAAGRDIASIGSEGPDAVTRPTLPYVAPDRGWGHEGYPAMGMTFHAAQKYCEWLSEKTGLRFRLPTVSEWRAAAWETCGTHAPTMDEMYWMASQADDTTHPVAARPSNTKGLYDLFGNVAEWCASDDADGTSVVCGGSFQTDLRALDDTELEAVTWFGERQTRAWNASDPAYPKSKWWLRDAPFVGFRVVCEDGPQ